MRSIGLLAAAVLAALASATIAPVTAASATTPILVGTWSDLQTAVYNSLPDPIVLTSDITGTNDNLAFWPGYTYILDLNGHNLSVSAPDNSAALDVPPGADVTIQATGGGTLTAIGGAGSRAGTTLYGAGAGIGGSGAYSANGLNNFYNAEDCGTVTIDSGTIIATGGTYFDPTSAKSTSGPGIGGGASVVAIAGNLGVRPTVKNSGAGCALTINGGSVTAIGGSEGAAAIGSGTAIAGVTSPGTPGSPGSVSLPGFGTPVALGAGTIGLAPTPSVVATPGVAFSITVVPGSANAGPSAAIVIGTTLTSYDGIGSSATVQYAALGAALPAQPSPSRSGFTFAGWRTGSPTGPAYSFSSLVNGPVTLYASWTPNSGSSNPPPLTQPQSASLAATGTNPVLPLGLAALALLAGGAAIILNRRRSAHPSRLPE